MTHQEAVRDFVSAQAGLNAAREGAQHLRQQLAVADSNVARAEERYRKAAETLAISAVAQTPPPDAAKE